jgi:hypothetical protein
MHLRQSGRLALECPEYPGRPDGVVLNAASERSLKATCEIADKTPQAPTCGQVSTPRRPVFAAGSQHAAEG